MHYIYSITNKSNNKSYIGQTENPDKRKKEHFKKSHNTNLRKDIKKYGCENFEFEILDETENPTDINFLEMTYIDKQKNDRYNTVHGGQLSSRYDRCKCDNCKCVFELRDFKQEKNTGFIYFKLIENFSKIEWLYFLCNQCNTKLYLNRNHCPSFCRDCWLPAVTNVLLILILDYNWSDELINKLIMVDGKINVRATYAFICRRLNDKTNFDNQFNMLL